MSSMVHIATDPTHKVAALLVDAVLSSQRFFVALSGGSTPKALFELLARNYSELPWDRVHIFQVDERCVPPDHADSNWRMLSESLLEHISVGGAYRLEAERGEDGAIDYEALIRREVPGGADRVPVLDLVLLGMGDDGHTASLFPGTTALEEHQRLVVQNEVPQLGAYRATMTYPLLHAARRRWFLATGAGKRAAFTGALRGEYPAGRVKNAEWFVDEALGASE